MTLFLFLLFSAKMNRNITNVSSSNCFSGQFTLTSGSKSTNHVASLKFFRIKICFVLQEKFRNGFRFFYCTYVQNVWPHLKTFTTGKCCAKYCVMVHIYNVGICLFHVHCTKYLHGDFNATKYFSMVMHTHVCVWRMYLVNTV